MYWTNSSVWAGCNTRSIFKRSWTGLNSEFSRRSVNISKLKKQSILLFTHGWRENSWMPIFLKHISTMQTDSAGMWTQVAASISYDDNHYTMSALNIISIAISISAYIYIYIHIYVYVCVCAIYKSCPPKVIFCVHRIRKNLTGEGIRLNIVNKMLWNFWECCW